MAHGSARETGRNFVAEVERRSAVECSRSAGSWKKSFLVAALWVSVALFLAGANEGAHTPDPPAAAQAADAAPGASAPAAPPLTGPVLAAILGLLSLSAFFSACEVAYFSLGPLRVRAMGSNEAFLTTGRA